MKRVAGQTRNSREAPAQARTAGDPKKTTPVEHDWIAAARSMLIEGGIAAVQINPLAARLGVTRGGFYWRFRNRQDLLNHLLLDWQNTNTRSLLMAVERSGTPRERFRRLVRLWLDETEFDPRLDTAVRQWGTIDQVVAAQVHQADDERIAALTRIFVDAGQEAIEAMVRARIVYFHQVGYYTLGIKETPQQRRKLMPYYTHILTAFED